MKKVILIVLVLVIVGIIIYYFATKKPALGPGESTDPNADQISGTIQTLLDPSGDPNYCKTTCDQLCKSLPALGSKDKYGSRTPRRTCETDCRSDCSKKADIKSIYPK